MKKKYTSSDIKRTLSVSERTARRYIEKHIVIEGNTKYISEDFFNFIIQKESKSGQGNGHKSDTNRTQSGHETDSLEIPQNEEFDHIEYFTEEEYQEFHKRLTEYPLLKEQIKDSKEHLQDLKNELEYHKAVYLKHLETHEKLIEGIKQRNYIEAKEKKLD
ncbi:hypothetical protein [Ornithobacterium rhinotracheale]|uniref:hypothetical protein n=1 Tax=Ornithobacterium rhinotracheale TaxID=28251 RepID=UPI004036F983